MLGVLVSELICQNNSVKPILPGIFFVREPRGGRGGCRKCTPPMYLQINEIYMVCTAAKNVYFSGDRHVSIMTSYRAKVTSYS